MRCSKCGAEVPIAYMCPRCKNLYCQEHASPLFHECMASSTPNGRKLKKEELSSSLLENIRLGAFLSAFLLLVTDQVLRVLARLKYSMPLETNFYVAALSLFTDPFVSPLIFLLAVCSSLFVTERRFKTTNGQKRGLHGYVSAFAIYLSVVMLLLPGIITWINLLF